MQGKSIYNQDFHQTDFEKDAEFIQEYEACIFTNCTFSQNQIESLVFIECEFIECNLSNCVLNNTAFRDVKFSDSKLLGLHFDDCNPFLLQVNFQNCDLSYATFTNIQIKDIHFNACQLIQVDFSQAKLPKAKFDHSDLHQAIFDNSDLKGADFRYAVNYEINPNNNQLKDALFAPENLSGLLMSFPIKIKA